MNELNILEPCCYHRLLPDFIRKESSVPIFHSGDVLASHIIDWLSNASTPGSTIYISLPSISSVTVDAVRQALRKRTYSRTEKRAVPTLSSIVVLTNVPSPSLLTLMKDYTSQSRPSSPNSGSRPSSAGYGSRPSPTGSGSRPSPAGSGSRPSSAGSGSRPSSTCSPANSNRLRVAIGSNMSFVATTSLSIIKDGTNVDYGSVMVHGNLLQMTTPGSSILTMTAGHAHFTPYKSYAELCFRHHGISSS